MEPLIGFAPFATMPNEKMQDLFSSFYASPPLLSFTPTTSAESTEMSSCGNTHELDVLDTPREQVKMINPMLLKLSYNAALDNIISAGNHFMGFAAEPPQRPRMALDLPPPRLGRESETNERGKSPRIDYACEILKHI